MQTEINLRNLTQEEEAKAWAAIRAKADRNARWAFIWSAAAGVLTLGLGSLILFLSWQEMAQGKIIWGN